MADTEQDAFSMAVIAKRNLAALAQQASFYQGQVEAQGNELRLLRQESTLMRIELDQLKQDFLQLRMSLVGAGPTVR